MQRQLIFTHIDNDGHACLEDRAGDGVCLPPVWLPKEAKPGAVLYAACVTNDEVSSMFFEIDREAEPW